MRIGALVAAMMLSLAATGCGASRRDVRTPASAPRWSTPATIPGVRSLTAVSCPLESFCVAVGDGQAVSYSAGGWSKPGTIDRYAAPKVALTTVSCTSSRFCVAGDSAGHAFRFDGTSWSSPTLLDGAGLADISCAGPGFCGAIDDAGEALLFDGSSWSRPTSIVDGPQLSSIACPTEDWCMAVDGASSSAYELDSGHWTPAGSLATRAPPGGSEPDTLSAVGCSSSSACAALDDFGDAFTWVHARWSAPFLFDANLLDQSDTVSCPTAGFCMAVDLADVVSTRTVDGWSQPRSLADRGGSLTGISCASSDFCVAVDSRGRELSYRRHWGG